MPQYILLATLEDGDGNPLGGKDINFYYSYTNSNPDTLFDTQTTNSSGQATTMITLTASAWVKAEFPGDTVYDASHDIKFIPITGVPEGKQTEYGMGLLLIILLILWSLSRKNKKKTKKQKYKQTQFF